MEKILGVASGVVVFGIWMWVVGNPRVVDTVIGLVLGVGVGFAIYRRLSSRARSLKYEQAEEAGGEP